MGRRVDVWDVNLQQTFRLRSMVFCTVNDFPAYGNLSGYTVKEEKFLSMFAECKSLTRILFKHQKPCSPK